jgi:hypothetical protein
MRVRHLSFALLLPATASPAGAQNEIPIRSIGPIVATSTEKVGLNLTVRGTSDGHVIVGAGARQRVYAFDSTLQHFVIVADSGTGTSQSVQLIGLIPYSGDSTLLPDFGGNALLVLDATGKHVRSIAPPKLLDLAFLGIPARFGHPGFDPQGRLIYRSQIRRNIRPIPAGSNQRIQMLPVNPDSAPIMRGDFETRTVDTIAWIRTPGQVRIAQELKESFPGGPSAITQHMLLNPFPMSDEWAVLSDGTIAIVRVHDYHIDWISPDGTRRSTPKMVTDWRRYTDAEKQARVESSRKIAEAQNQRQTTAPGGAQMRYDIAIVPDSEFPEFWPPIRPGSVLADLDARLWILPTASTNSANGLTYDVINRQGEVIERVQLPIGRELVGFGPHGVVYLRKREGAADYLERALLNGPAKAP